MTAVSVKLFAVGSFGQAIYWDGKPGRDQNQREVRELGVCKPLAFEFRGPFITRAEAKNDFAFVSMFKTIIKVTPSL